MPVAAQLQAVMVHAWSEKQDLTKYSALLLGPGLAASNLPEDLRRVFRELWKTDPLPIVVDASALDWLKTTTVIPYCRVLTPHPGEVAAVFEAPLHHILDPAHQHVRTAFWRGRERTYYEIDWQEQRIWGATAAMIVNLGRRLALAR